MTSPPLLRIAQPWRPLWWRFEQHRRHSEGVTLAGYHNRNQVVRLRDPFASLVGVRDGEFAKFREPLRTVRVVPRLWRHEATLMRAISPYVPSVPRCLTAFGQKALYTYADGVTLSELHPKGERVGERHLIRLAGIFGQMSTVPSRELPRHRRTASSHHDSAGFLRYLADFAERRVHRANRRRFGRLFDELRFPLDAMVRFRDEADALEQRPFGLLHTDLHRANIVVLPDGQLFVLDWEAALFGDPLHDLATHLVRMDYTLDERQRMIELWQSEMTDHGLDARLVGLKSDLPVYLDFEYAQSLYPDTLRAAIRLENHPGPRALDSAVSAISRALRRAQAPLKLMSLPSDEDIRRALCKWIAAA